MKLNPEILLDCIRTKMPYGKYKGILIADIPVYYLEWYHGKGFPKGKLGMMLSTVYEIKINGLSSILNDLKAMDQPTGNTPTKNS